MNTKELTFEEFLNDAGNAALDLGQAEAMAWLAKCWFGKEASERFMTYWRAENKQ